MACAAISRLAAARAYGADKSTLRLRLNKRQLLHSGPVLAQTSAPDWSRLWCSWRLLSEKDNFPAAVTFGKMG